MNTAMLPTPPELTPQRRDAIRTELLRSMDTDRRWQRPAVMATAAASVVAVAGVAAWQVAADGGGSGPERLTAAASPAIPWLSEGERADIERRCNEAADNVGEFDVDGAPRVPGPDGDFVLYNVSPQAFLGRYALLYDLGRNQAIGCSIPGPDAEQLNVSIDYSTPQRDLDWMAGELAEEHASSIVRDSGGGQAVSAGRIGAEVSRVTISSGSQTVEATIANGTYIGVLQFPSTVAEPPEDLPTVRGYDADGNLVAEVEPARDGCWITPDGEVIQGDDDKPEQCLPAQRWPQAN
ncbi:MAG: hypothetical protein ACRDQB_11675 [Thermocrispum sp.]